MCASEGHQPPPFGGLLYICSQSAFITPQTEGPDTYGTIFSVKFRRINSPVSGQRCIYICCMLDEEFNNRRRKRTSFRSSLDLTSAQPPLLVRRTSHYPQPAMFVPQPAQMVRRIGGKRPIDKSIIAISKDGIDSTQVSTTLATVTFPCTITGLRWDLSFFSDSGTTINHVAWAIVVVRDGNTLSTITISDGGNLHDPEQNVLTWGFCTCAKFEVTKPVVYRGDTKTMRKMMGGDTLKLAILHSGTDTAGVRGGIQFFCKT